MNFGDLFLQKNIVVEDTLYPLYTEMAINLSDGTHISEDGEIVILYGNDAIKVWILKTLKTWRGKYRLYSTNFGTTLYEEIGTIYDEETKKQLLYNEIDTTLRVLPHIRSTSNYSSVFDNDTGRLSITFTVNTIYGSFEEVTNV